MRTKPVKYLGNPATKEVHGILRLKPECNIKDASDEKYKHFHTQREARDAGYDGCAKGCLKRFKSRENT